MLYTWGCGEDGQLGHGDLMNSIIPRLVKGLREKAICQVQRCGLQDLTSVPQVACGYYHTCAIPDTWETYTWGWGDNGRLGHGLDKSVLRPKRIESLIQVALLQPLTPHSQ